MKIDLQYRVSEAIEAYLEADRKTIEDFAKGTGLSKATVYQVLETNSASGKTLETIYSFLYRSGYRLNAVKEDFLREKNQGKILFHGSKNGLEKLTSSGSRRTCDFGRGFYLGESYSQALSFVCENDSSSVYSFAFSDGKLKALELGTSLDWMLAICYFRGSIPEFSSSERVLRIVKGIEESDLIVAPIADNRMFYIMSLFAGGDINSEVAIHSLSASKLGRQYILKSESAIQAIKPLERYYLSSDEKKDCQILLNKRASEMDSKLKLAKREFKEGMYIEELLK